MKNIDLARKALDELRKFYPLGLYEWLYKNNKSQYDKIVQVENDLHKIISTGTEKQTKELLTVYWTLHRKAIDEFINSEESVELELNYAEVRKVMLEARVCI